MLRTSVARAKYRHELLRREQTESHRPYRFQFYGTRGALAANGPASIARLVGRFQSSRSKALIKTTVGTPTGRIRVHAPVWMYLERGNYLVNEIKLGWIKGRAVARAWALSASGGEPEGHRRRNH